ncbi:MAG: hypothetical protein CMN98_04815 [Synechococcus sp. NP17]|nr:hypothetical protein [Synechococcus sp. NP17]
MPDVSAIRASLPRPKVLNQRSGERHADFDLICRSDTTLAFRLLQFGQVSIGIDQRIALSPGLRCFGIA